MTRQIIAWGAFAEVRGRIIVGRKSTGAGPHTLTVRPATSASCAYAAPVPDDTVRHRGRPSGWRAEPTTAGEIPDAPGEPLALLSSRSLTPWGQPTGSRPDPAASPHQQDSMLVDRSVNSSPDNYPRGTERSDERRPHADAVDRVGRTAATKLAPHRISHGRGGATLDLAAALARVIDLPGSRPIAASKCTTVAPSGGALPTREVAREGPPRLGRGAAGAASRARGGRTGGRYGTRAGRATGPGTRRRPACATPRPAPW